MILNIYAFKDNGLGCFTQPFYNDVPIENLEVGVTRAIVGADVSKRSSYKHKVLYKIGVFDDTNGKIESVSPELVLDCDEVLARLDDGKGNKEASA